MKLDILQSSKMVEHRTPSSGGRETAGVAPSAEEKTQQDDRAGQGSPASLQPGAEAATEKWVWNPDGFAREQLRGLVQRIFFSQATVRMRQVVISAAESGTDVSDICLQVGEALSQETSASVVVVAGDVSGLPAELSAGLSGGVSGNEEQQPDSPRRSALATRVYGNLWLTPGLRRRETVVSAGGDVTRNVRREMISSAAWYSRLCDFRREFEYSILEGPAAGESSDSAIAAQVADGMILVLTAHGTRRATVHRIQETLKSTQTHLLGTILAERRFPIPEGIYRRL
jgi:Mrp family chromosome partitioning ATPase